jgi:hypothetical protein
MGGLASGDVGYVQATKAATGGKLWATAVGIHPYGILYCNVLFVML